jgi:uncharacterized protein
MRIATLHTYPLKGCHRLDHDEAGVEPWGMTGDRRWMAIDPDGVGITQREVAQLSQVQVRPRPGGLTLHAPGMPALAVDEPVDGPKEFVRVFRHKPPVPARIAGDRGWLSGFLGRPTRLAWQADATGRTIRSPTAGRPVPSPAAGRAGPSPAAGRAVPSPAAGRPVADHARDSDRVSLADGYPVLLTTTASLSALNDWLLEAGEEPVPMTRFRPNVVVQDADPWAEDDFAGRRLQIGAVTFRVASPCDRCLVTTIDQDTGVKTGQPLKMLGRHRRFPGGLLFGMNLIPDVTPGATGIIRVGDRVTVLS